MREVRQQQTATSEILRVISSSPTDLQPVLHAIAESAARLSNANDAVILQVEGEFLKVVAQYGPLSGVPIGELLPIRRTMITGTAILDRRTMHIHDGASEEVNTEFPDNKQYQKRIGYRTILITPFLREDCAIGVIAIRRIEVAPFSDKQIELIRTFADQAVIAIENVRLFKELEERNKALTEALEQQTATSEILRVISQSQRDVQPVFEAIAGNARRLCKASWAVFYTFDGELIRYATTDGMSREAIEATHRTFPMPPSRGSALGRAILTRAIAYIPDVREDAEYRLESLAQTAGYRSTVSVPILRDEKPIGAISVSSTEPSMFSERQIAMLQTFADQAVIAIENVRLFKELEERNKALTESLEQQTATSEILRVISSSPTDLQPVLDTVSRNAAALCGAKDAAIFRVEGDVLRLVAASGPLPRLGPDETIPIHRDSINGRAVLERRLVHVPDLLAEPGEEFAIAKALGSRLGFRAALAAPMLREGIPTGVIIIERAEPGPFSDKQIEVIKTFADQAVIAIENTRLFKELQERLEQQTATSEILRVISQSQSDVQPVFETIAENARKLCEATFSGVLRFDGEVIHVAAAVGYSPEALEAVHRTFPMPLSRGGRAFVP